MVVDRGVSWEVAVQLYEQHLSDHQSLVGDGPSQAAAKGSGFYCSRREQYHHHLYLLALQKENSTHLFNIVRCTQYCNLYTKVFEVFTKL